MLLSEHLLSLQGELFGWGNSEYAQFGLVTQEQQLNTPTHLPMGQEQSILSRLSVGRLAGMSDCHNVLKGREVSLPCSEHLLISGGVVFSYDDCFLSPRHLYNRSLPLLLRFIH